MNYKNIYDNLILSRQNLPRNKKFENYELHHIIPKCIGGTDAPENLILLTPREHFIAHFLLWKNDKLNDLLFAPLLLFKKDKHVINSRTYQLIRSEHIRRMKENNPSKNLSEESKLSKSNKLKEYSLNRPESHNRKISESKIGSAPRLGSILSDESKDKISKSLIEYFKNNQISQETRDKISKANLGRKHHDDFKLKCSIAAKNRKKYLCPLCQDKSRDGGNMALHMKKVHGFSKDKIINERNEWLV